ncbi:MAG: OmpA family protein [Campylobacteraceae bacterium]|jgi:outer membrane protein OmpA-like peptidoglycan-associated protein|nr:OmpA family protein [Campylobacteraceae bacterium]
MKPKIRVHGRSQNRTALGIINAYLKLYPNSTPSDVKQAFPKSLNSKCSAEHFIVPVRETAGHEKMFFEREDELIVFGNGEKFALAEVWIKEDFDAIRKHAKQYGIETAKEGTKPFEKGSFELEYIENSKCKFCWLWLLLLLLLLLAILLFFWKYYCNQSKSTDVATNAAPATTIVADENIAPIVDVAQEDKIPVSLVVDNDSFVSITLPNGSVLNIAKNSAEFKLFSFLNSQDTKVETDLTQGWITLDSVHFNNGKTELSDKAKNQLQNIAKIMQFFPNSHIKVGGYTDNTGTDEANARVSTQRAKAAAEKIISSGVEASRVNYEGYGSQHPVCPPNDSEKCKADNRRVDIRVTQK